MKSAKKAIIEISASLFLSGKLLEKAPKEDKEEIKIIAGNLFTQLKKHLDTL